MFSLPSSGGSFQVPEGVPTGRGVRAGLPFPEVMSPWRHQLVGPSSCFVFGHRFTRVATEICLIPIHMNPTGLLLLWNAWCWRSQSASKSLWDNLSGFGKTPGVGYCCLLKFSLGESILEKKVMAIKRDGTLECAESAGVGSGELGAGTLFLSLIMFLQTFCLGLEPSQFS